MSIKETYYRWLCELVEDDKHSHYHKLLRKLHDSVFYYTIPMDGNREEDGIDMRYRFGEEYSYKVAEVMASLDNSPCTVLEMMVALAVRCEEHIMDDPDIGNRTSEWFWRMIQNLGLSSMDDENYDDRYIRKVLSIFLDRRYNRDGTGGLFIVKHNRIDMRSVEIWYQAMWYLDEFLKGAH